MYCLTVLTLQYLFIFALLLLPLHLSCLSYCSRLTGFPDCVLLVSIIALRGTREPDETSYRIFARDVLISVEASVAPFTVQVFLTCACIVYRASILALLLLLYRLSCQYALVTFLICVYSLFLLLLCYNQSVHDTLNEHLIIT